jgi:photosystem II stability/assembly factor-like uncharacterized protein
MKYISFTIIFLTTSLLFAQEWTGTSGPPGGEVRKIIIDPNNVQTVYAIANTAFSGVYKSDDGGKTWFVLTKGLEFDEIESEFRTTKDLTLDIIESSTLFVSVNQPQSMGSSYLYRTTNYGEEWLPIKKDIIYALCAKNGNVFALSDSGLIYSSNRGDTWITQNTFLGGDKILLDDQNILWIWGSNGLYRSADSGRTYQQFVFPNLWRIEAFDAAIVEGKKCIAVSVATSPAKYDSLFISYNEGITWINRTETLPYEPSLSSYEIPSVLKISRQNPDNIFAGSPKGFFRTTDGGIHWIKQDSGLTLSHAIYSNYQTVVSSVEVSQKDSNIIFAGTTNDGIYRSSNGGIIWQFINMPSGKVNTISVSPSDKIYCGTTSGLYYSNDDTWLPTSMLIGQVLSLNGITASAVSPYNSNLILVGLQNSLGYGMLYKTTEDKTTWQLKMMLAFEGIEFTKILFDPVDSNRVYATWSGGIIASDNGGDSWYHLLQGFNSMDMIIDPTDNDRLFVLGKKGAIYLSTDKGITWNTLRDGTDSLHTVIRFDPSNTQRLYVGGFYLYVTENCGLTWEQKSFDKKVTDIAIDTETGELFVSTFNEGTYRSTDGGNIFSKMPKLPSERITKLLFCTKDKQKKLIIGTRGIGLYEYDLGPSLSVVESNLVPKTFALFQNYPNPFNPGTIIEYFLPLKSYVQLKIYDILGREVKMLVNEEQFTGKHLVYWDGKNEKEIPVSPGIYFYTLCSGEYVMTKKMILLK